MPYKAPKGIFIIETTYLKAATHVKRRGLFQRHK